MTSPESSSQAIPCAVDLLEEEAVAAEDSRAERLLEADAERDAGGGAEEAVAVNHVLVSAGRPRRGRCVREPGWRRRLRRGLR